MFHLSLPVVEFEKCLEFYKSAFEARVVKLAPGIANVMVFDAQVTLHDRENSALKGNVRKEMHFGSVVTLAEWVRIHDRLADLGVQLLRCVQPDSEPESRAKLVVADPSGNLIEINSSAGAFL